jgi:hypothetical protein
VREFARRHRHCGEGKQRARHPDDAAGDRGAGWGHGRFFSAGMGKRDCPTKPGGSLGSTTSRADQRSVIRRMRRLFVANMRRNALRLLRLTESIVP